MHHKQIRITRDDQFRIGGKRGGDDHVIGRIGRHGARDRPGRDDRRQSSVALQSPSSAIAPGIRYTHWQHDTDSARPASGPQTLPTDVRQESHANKRLMRNGKTTI